MLLSSLGLGDKVFYALPREGFDMVDNADNILSQRRGFVKRGRGGYLKTTIDIGLFLVYSKSMDPMKAKLLEEGSKVVGSFLRMVVTRPRKTSAEPEEETVETSSATVTVQPAAASKPAIVPVSTLPSAIALPTSDETTVELKRRLSRELYRAELDLAAGLKIAGKPCDCLSNKHTLMLEAASEELISQDPSNPVYREIITWIGTNSPKVSIEAIQSGKYAGEYPRMANEFKLFRKRVMGTVAASERTGATITLEQAKKLAAEEAAKEVERQWKEVPNAP